MNLKYLFPNVILSQKPMVFLGDIFCCFFTKKFEEIWEFFCFSSVNSTNFFFFSFLEKKIPSFQYCNLIEKKTVASDVLWKNIDTKLEVIDLSYKAKFKTSCRLFICLVILKPSLGTPMSNTHVHLGIQS
jgi:hypothetical protein